MIVECVWLFCGVGAWRVKAISKILDWHEIEGNNKGNCEIEE